MVVELLAHCLELFPDFCLGRRRHILDGTEVLLKLLKVLELDIDIVDVARDLAHFRENLLLFGEIVAAAAILGLEICGPTLFEIGMKVLELRFRLIRFGHKSVRLVASLDKGGKRLHALAALHVEESLLEGGNLPVRLHVVGFEYRFQFRKQLLLCHGMIPVHIDSFCGLIGNFCYVEGRRGLLDAFFLSFRGNLRGGRFDGLFYGFHLVKLVHRSILYDPLQPGDCAREDSCRRNLPCGE